MTSQRGSIPIILALIIGVLLIIFIASMESVFGNFLVAQRGAVLQLEREEVVNWVGQELSRAYNGYRAARENALSICGQDPKDTAHCNPTDIPYRPFCRIHDANHQDHSLGQFIQTPDEGARLCMELPVSNGRYCQQYRNREFCFSFNKTLLGYRQQSPVHWVAGLGLRLGLALTFGSEAWAQAGGGYFYFSGAAPAAPEVTSRQVRTLKSEKYFLENPLGAPQPLRCRPPIGVHEGANCVSVVICLRGANCRRETGDLILMTYLFYE